MRTKVIIAAIVTTLAVALIPAGNASAAAAHAGVFTGTAGITGDSLFLPGLGGSASGAGWNFSGTCTGVNCTSISGSGTLNSGLSGLGAFCGASGGSGSGSIDGHSGTLSVEWLQSAGTMLPITVSGAHTGAILVNARAAGSDPANGVIKCVNSGATAFDIVGVGALA